MTHRTTPNFIGGRFVDPMSGLWLDNTDPSTNQLLTRLARSNGDDVDAACKAAAAAQESWGARPPTERADLLDIVASGIEARSDEFARTESEDQGKPVALARSVDIPRAVANFRFFAGAIRHDETGFHEMQGHLGRGALNYTLRRPVGPCALITPWNLPLYLLTWKAAPALAMGNTVVAKPSEFTPRTANLLAEVMSEAGIPDGVFNLVHGLGAEAGAPLTAHADIAAVSFTGGTATGRLVAASAAPAFKKLSLELGGKNATLIFADSDLEAAMDGAARAGFANQGEICLCGSRILVEDSVFDEVVAGLVQRVEALVVGDPRDPGTDLGALVSRAHREKVEGYIRLAQEEGGTVVAGGVRPDLPSPFGGGNFLRPTLITGLSPSCRTATEEIFGPVVTVHRFSSEAEAVQVANGTRYGLSASVWTNHLQRAHRVAAALETGLVWINTWLLRDLRVPFGGVKDSGVGREGGPHSMEFYSELKNVCVQL